MTREVPQQEQAVSATATELEIAEAPDFGASPVIRPDGLVAIHIIRPGLGRGRGRHLYPAAMLQEAVKQGRFENWPMYVDHLSQKAKAMAGGLPRSMRDLGGVVKKVWWDPEVPSDRTRGHEQGAVAALAKPTRFVRSLIEDIPEAVGTSISTGATGVKPVTHLGETAWLVEGIRPKGSVDWVTEAGAGGRVVSLMEALQESLDEGGDDDIYLEVIEAMEDGELFEHLQATRPELVTSLVEAAVDGDGNGDGDGDEHEKLVKKYLKKFKGNRGMAERAAKREMSTRESTHLEGGDAEVDTAQLVEALEEALDTPDGQAALTQAFEPIVASLFTKIVAPKLGELVEAAMADERELNLAEADAVTGRRLQVRDLREVAHEMIEEAPLPAAHKTVLLEKYELIEGEPTEALDIVDEKADGKIVKTAEEKLREAVNTDIATFVGLHRASRPSRVRDQGASTITESGGDGGKPKTDDDDPDGEKGEKKKPLVESVKTRALLEEAGIEPTQDLYAGILD